ncbi:hypothetical protein MMMB2_3330 [Mycobacterium marinum MB2]|nr:hypothetical protein MMMB2_3330 [Mycobacterium marinum MB2]
MRQQALQRLVAGVEGARQRGHAIKCTAQLRGGVVQRLGEHLQRVLELRLVQVARAAAQILQGAVERVGGGGAAQRDRGGIPAARGGHRNGALAEDGVGADRGQ